MLDTARAAALGRPFARATRSAEIYRLIKRAQDHARLRQHPQPGRGHLSGALAHQRRQSRHRAPSRLARRGAAPQGRGGDGGRPPARGGVHLIARSRRRLGRRRSRRSMSARRRAPRGCCSASAAPITAWTSLRRACWFRPTASRCWNAAPRSTPSPRMRRTRRPRASARSTCWPSTCSAAPAASRS